MLSEHALSVYSQNSDIIAQSYILIGSCYLGDICYNGIFIVHMHFIVNLLISMKILVKYAKYRFNFRTMEYFSTFIKAAVVWCS